MPASKSDVSLLYRMILDRPLNDAELSHWAGMDVDQVFGILSSCQEFAGRFAVLGEYGSLERLDENVAPEWECARARIATHARHAFEAQQIPLVAYCRRAGELELILTTLPTRQFIAPQVVATAMFGDLLRRRQALQGPDCAALGALMSDQYYLSRLLALLFTLTPLFGEQPVALPDFGWLANDAAAGPGVLHMYCLHEQALPMHQRYVFEPAKKDLRQLSIYRLS